MGVRAGQGFGSSKPKRMRCPQCKKKGVTSGKPIPSDILRYCQYCQASWGDAAWRVVGSQCRDSGP